MTLPHLQQEAKEALDALIDTLPARGVLLEFLSFEIAKACEAGKEEKRDDLIGIIVANSHSFEEKNGKKIWNVDIGAVAQALQKKQRAR